MSLAVVFNGRRKTVKVSPNTTMQTVLEMACTEHGITQSSNYVLTHKKAAIDPSQPFRFTGIPNNATVDLAEQKGRGSQKVRMALQVAGGSRLQDSFDPNTSLLDLLGHFVAGGQLDRAYVDQEAVVVYLRQSFQGQDTLTNTTLRSMGLVSGSALLNLRLASGEVPAVAPPPAPAMPQGGVEESKMSGTAPHPPPPPPEVPAPPSAVAAQPPHPTAPAKMDVDEAGGGGDDGAAYAASSIKAAAMSVVSNSSRAGSGGEGSSLAPCTQQSSTAGGGGGGGGGNSSSSSSSCYLAIPPEATPMDVVVMTSPRVGFKAAQEALDFLQSTSFESDLKETVALLVKYIDNIVGRPQDPKTRAIKCSNAHYQTKVAARQGGREFLLALGFKEEQRGFSHDIAKDPLQHTFLVLPSEAEDTSLLLRSRRLLYDLGRTIDLDAGPPPDPTASRNQRSSSDSIGGSGSSSSGQAAFDPYRPSTVSMTMQLPRDQGPSLTEIKLKELKQKQQAIQAELPDRSLQVILPGSASTTGNGSGGGGGSASSSFDVDDTAAAPGDMAQVAKSLAHRMAMRKREEDAPFRTKAQRELESLERAKVYSHTVLRVQLPDRTVILAKFHPRETVGDVRRLVVQEVLSEEGQARAFTLYVSPPRRVLQDSAVLQEEGMVPAAIIYLSWDEGAGPTPSSLPFIRSQLLPGGGDQQQQESDGLSGSSSSTTDVAAVLYPKGVDLVEKKKAAEAERDFGGGAKREASGEDGAGKGKKPAWLQLG